MVFSNQAVFFFILKRKTKTVDDAVFAERPGETSPPFPELSHYKQGDSLHHSLFPVCWEKAHKNNTSS